MPMPIPTQLESKEDFIQRCMKNELMNEEFPNEEQRLVVCNLQYNKDQQKTKILNKKNMENKKKTKYEKLVEKYKSFLKGESEAPVLIKNVDVIERYKSKDGMYRAVLSIEKRDREGEVVSLEGLINPGVDVVFIDGHNQDGMVHQTRGGTIKNVRVENKQLVGDILFSKNYVGQELEKIAMDSRQKFPISIGMGVYEIDEYEKIITKWELYEGSAVNIESNVGTELKSFDPKTLKNKVDQLEHDKKALKEYRKLFMSTTLWKSIGENKTNDEFLNMSKLYDIINLKKGSEETPAEQPNTKVETPQIYNYKKLRQAVFSNEKG